MEADSRQEDECVVEPRGRMVVGAVDTWLHVGRPAPYSPTVFSQW